MTRRWIASVAWVVLAGCPASEVVDAGTSSSEGGTTESSGTVDPTTGTTTSDPSTTTTDPTTSSDTGCVDGCTTGPDTSGSSGAVDTTDGTSSTGITTAEESSSSEGPVTVCGDGIVDFDEDCDDAGESAVCDDDCTFVECGDANPNQAAGEFCDAGGESLNCDVDCTAPVCGDGITNASDNEFCDDGGPSPTCDVDCTTPSCGDGSLNPAFLETCDDGNNDSQDGCSAACLIEGDFGGLCRIVDGVQWCFDNDNCGQACEDVCGALGLTLEPNDATWFAAQDTPAECQAISDAFGLVPPIAFDALPLGCLEDTGLAGTVGGGLSGSLACSSDPACPAAHRTDMDDLGGTCNLPGARRSVCPCAGAYCGNGLVEGAEVCDDGNEINNDGCNSNCNTGPSVCDGGTDPGTGAPYVVCAVDGDGAWVANADSNGGSYHPELICQELGYTTVGEWGGNCGNVCGYCEDVTSCLDNGTPTYDFGMWTGFGNCGEDGLGQLICQTVHWTCI
jgi:cysteine-rich repeat protein